MTFDYVAREALTAWWVFWHPKRAAEKLDHLIHMAERADDEKERAYKSSDELRKAINEIHQLVTSVDEPFYSWQRVWQNVARLKYGLGEQGTIDDIKVAVLLDATQQKHLRGGEA